MGCLPSSKFIPQLDNICQHFSNKHIFLALFLLTPTPVCPQEYFLGGFSGFLLMAMGFLLECLHKVHLGYCHCINGESDFTNY